MARDLILMEDVHFLTVSIGKNVIVFRIDMSSSVHIDKKGVTLIFGKGTTQGLDLQQKQNTLFILHNQKKDLY